MLEIINTYMKYVYLGLGFILFIVLIVLFVRIGRVKKSLNVDIKGIDDINAKLDKIKEKSEYLKQSFSTSWAFFIEIAAILQIIKVVIRDYKGTPKAKRSMIKSTARSVIHNPKTIARVKNIF